MTIIVRSGQTRSDTVGRDLSQGGDADDPFALTAIDTASTFVIADEAVWSPDPFAAEPSNNESNPAETKRGLTVGVLTASASINDHERSVSTTSPAPTVSDSATVETSEDTNAVQAAIPVPADLTYGVDGTSLVTIDPGTGALTTVATLTPPTKTLPVDGVCGNGYYYVDFANYALDGSGTAGIDSVNLTTGAVSFKAFTGGAGLNRVFGLSVDPTGVLYGVDGTSLVTIDPGTGALTTVATVTPPTKTSPVDGVCGNGYYYVDFANNALDGSGTAGIDSVNLTTGAVSFKAFTGGAGLNIVFGLSVPSISVLDYLEFSQLAYDKTLGGGDTVPTPYGFSVLGQPTQSSTGLNAVAFIDTATQQIVLAYRGSVSSYDWLTSDWGIARGTRPAVFDQAENFAANLINNSAYAGYTFYVTGHSLGAAEAEDVSAYFDLGGDLFAGPGVSNLLNVAVLKPPITDFVIATDPAGMYATDTLTLSTPNGSHVGTVQPLLSVEYLSNTLLKGVLNYAGKTVGGFLGGTVGSGLATGIAALTQHPLYSYGQSLLNAKLIVSNPIAHPSYVFGDLTEIYKNIQNVLGTGATPLVADANAAGDITETGTVSVTTPNGTVTVNISETLLAAGGTTLSVTETLGANTLSQSATLDPNDTLTSDVVSLNGVVVTSSTTMPGDIDFTSGGSLMIGEGAIQPSQARTLIVGSSGSVAVAAPTAADFTGRGNSDVLWHNGTSGDTGVWAIANNTISGWVGLGASTTYNVVGVGDFNADGISDILWRNPTSGDTGYWTIANNSIAGWTDLGQAPTTYSVAGVGDFNGDGTSDVLWHNGTTGDTGVWAIANNAISRWVGLGASTTYNVVGVGDFNGDGISDILWRNPTSGDTGFWTVANNTIAGWTDLGQAPTTYSVVGVGDFNGDGTSDVLWHNSATGDTGFWAITNNAISGWVGLGASTAYNVVGVGDFNGDGISDILWRNPTSGDTGYWTIANNAIAGWTDLGQAPTTYTVENGATSAGGAGNGSRTLGATFGFADVSLPTLPADGAAGSIVGGTARIGGGQNAAITAVSPSPAFPATGALYPGISR